MGTFEHSFVVDCSIDKVWNFYTDIEHLKVITPKKMNLKIIQSSSQTIMNHQDAIIEAKIGFMTKKWHTKITSLKKYEYVDEMMYGPFKKWKHTHRFKKLDEDQTEIIDKIEFELPYGRLGKMFEGFAYKNLNKIFKFRKFQTINKLTTNLNTHY